MQSVPQWLWCPVLEGVTSAVTKASSLQEAVASLSELPAAFNSALLPQVVTIIAKRNAPCLMRCCLSVNELSR